MLFTSAVTYAVTFPRKIDDTVLVYCDACLKSG